MSAANLLDRILKQLADVRTQCPELRFGQLMTIIGELAEDETGHSLWDVEDAEFVAAVERFAADIARRKVDRSEEATTTTRGGITSRVQPLPSRPDT